MDGLAEFNIFLGLHRNQLTSSGVPENYWHTIYRKLENEIFDAGTTFLIAQTEDDDENRTVVVKTPSGLDCVNSEHVYLIDHAWTFEAKDAILLLKSVPSLLQRIANIVGLNIEMDTDQAVEAVYGAAWKYLRTYSEVTLANTPPAILWYIMDEFGCCIQHSLNPNCRAVPFYYHPQNTAYTLLFPIKDIAEGEEVLIDYVEGAGDIKSREALSVPWTCQSFVDEDEEQSEPDVAYFLSGANNETIPTSLVPRPAQSGELRVFSEYSKVNEFLTAPGFVLVDNEEEADVLWLTRHFTQYSDLNESRPGTFINQFPCERVLTTKDLLAIVCRRGGVPLWLPLTYNLVTELSLFVGVFQRRESSGLDNHWICKPWNLARALDTTVTNNLDCILRLPFSGPKIAQKYAEKPLLFQREEIGWVKFDVRYVVLLTRTQPLQLFAYKKFFLRFANKSFALDELCDYEKHFTVMNYRGNSPLHRMLCEDFIPAFESQYPQFKWDDIEEKLLSVLKEAFTRACKEPPPRGLADFPQSRALYAADLLLTWNHNDIQPLLLEINYGPDCGRACEYYPDFYNDVFNLMFKNISDSSRFHIL